jgi:uncharacterized protein (TIGR03382 family)
MSRSMWLGSPFCAGLGLLAISTTATAAPIEFVEQRDSYMIFRDVDQSVEYANWFERDPFLAGYDAVESGFLANHPDDSQFMVMFTTWELPPPVGALYQSVANDVHGIGYEHIAPEDAVIPDEGMGYFDDTPNSQVQGFLHMNHWTNYLGGDPGGVSDNYISLVFGQELGHAWLAFVYFDQGQGLDNAMLGRSNAHWSFYMNTGGSPVQGHEWIDNGDGTFTAVKQSIYEYSDLDLYLMGLLPPDQVEPWFVLENPTNCIDSAAKDGSCAPLDAFLFQADSYTVTADRRDITIEDVIAAEGERTPAWPDAPDEFDVSFILVTRADEVLDEGQKALMDAIIGRSIEIFDAQTRGYARVVNRTAPGQGGDTSGSGGDDDPTEPTTADGTADGAGTLGSEGDASASATGASGTAGTVGSADGSGDSSGGAGADDDDAGGCGCASTPLGGGAPWLGALAFAAIRRRRR